MNLTHCLPLASLAVVLAMHGPAAASGALLYHDDQASFAAAVAGAGLAGNLVSGNLAAAGAAHGVTEGNPYGVIDPTAVTIGAASFVGLNDGNAASFLVENNYRIGGVFYLHGIFNGLDNALTISFAVPVRAFSFTSNVFNVTIAGAPGPVPLTLTLSTGQVIQTSTTPYYFGGPVDPPEAAPLVFNGLVSDTAFTSITISTQAQNFNVTAFALAPVPEPQSALLLLAGLGVIGGVARRRRGWSAVVRAAALAAGAVVALPASAASAVVPGAANPNLAGRDPGYSCCSGDALPGQAPTLVSGLALTGGAVLTFSVSGEVSYGGGPVGGNNPDGSPYGGVPINYGDGIAAPVNLDRVDALVGVFLGVASPTGGATPASIDYAGGIGFASQSPLIGQMFFIGDGLTGSLAGSVQQFIIPGGATRLYLGTVDGYEWGNNSGQFNVDVSLAAVPEPGSLALMAGGLAAIGFVSRRRRPQ